jgi:tetrahydromethanopterin S-methyltransferase subunit G
MRINKDLGIATGMVVGALIVVQMLITTLEALARHG